ncbi:AAA family ATPase [Bacillus sp. BR_7]|uniref:AAA family ATPase n=1 Tax=Bacillus TaxID=1386 RepID=UPI00207AB7C3|nr:MULTISPECIES: AAA family ATPase [Bacillus cereus group]MDA1536475.1 AAA family ATPase [Bacillus cereus group sp. TH254-2LC]USL02714.1 AAA family ATPase [Bacillus anthracis]HDR7257774.1 AAA family ATPase [Bacillus paranthracis]
MYISSLDVTNFRNFKNATFKFKEGINTLIGENSSGKSNALYAIRLLLDDTLPLNASKLLETDFNRSLNDWKGHWIILKITFNKLDSSEAANFVSHHTADISADDSIGTYGLYFRPNKNMRRRLFEFTQSQGSPEELKSLLTGITINDYETVFTCRINGDFNDEDTYKSLVGDFEKGIFPNPDEEDLSLLGNISPHITLIKKEVSCTFVKALRNVIAELKQRKSSPLLNLLRGTAKEIEIAEAEEIRNKVKTLNEGISELNEIEELTKKIRASLNSTLGYTYSPQVSIKSELPEEIETLLHSLTLWVGDDASSNQGKLDDLSLGGANLIYITLKLLEYEFYQTQEEKAAHFLLIEEPEAHIHTHIQKTLFDKYQFENTQVIITSHSTHISSASKIDSVNVLIKDQSYTKVCHPSEGLDESTCKRIERYLDATRSTLLFAKGVILVEGDAELILVPEMFKAVFGLTLDEIGVSVINVSSTVFEHIAKLFDDQRIHRKCAIITDLDEAIEVLPSDEKEDTKEQKDMRASQKSGAERKQVLDDTYNNNPWVNVYYAPHTFEIDFAISGNEYEVKSTLPFIYKQDTYIEDSKKLLDSDDPSVVGKEALRLAKKEGKGWFALLLTETLFVRTKIPNYILEAIAFTSEHITENHLKAMAKYRIEQEINSGNKRLSVDGGSLLENKTLNELIEIISLDDDEDDLIHFIQLLGVEIEVCQTV